jgi:selenocysteine lyase/cysteine desulfurase
MLDSQRRHFQLPREIAYLDAAAITPRAVAVRTAANAALEIGDRPWAPRELDKKHLLSRLREQSAALIGARARDMAVAPAVSYAMATAAANIDLPRQGRLLLLTDDHPSSYLVWKALAEARDAIIDWAPRPADGDWTSALLEHIERPGAPAVGVAVVPPLHWTDGTVIDLPRIARALRAQGAALVVDAEQAAGVLPLDVAEIEPDFLAFPAYKWLLGPYGLAFLYASPKRQNGRPLEQHMNNRVEPALRLADTVGDYSFREGAERFDQGERDDIVALSMATGALQLLGSWDRSSLLERLRALTDQVAEGAAGLNLEVADRRFRAPHIIGLKPRSEIFESAVGSLASQNVFVSPRRGFIRVSPHAYNDPADVDRLIQCLRKLVS